MQPASDVYSLGATMFHLLTGSDPQDNPLLIFDFSKNPRPRQIAPSISTEMELILMRSVEYKPEDRYRTAGELRNELAIHLEKLMSGRVSYGMPAPVSGIETVQVRLSTAVFAVVGLQPTTCSVRTARDSRSPVSERSHRCCIP